MPGTGENPAPLNILGDELILELAKQARGLGNGTVIHFGLSFGGNFAAMTGLSGAVDAAIVLGGPVDKAYSRENLERLPYGMSGIICNDMGFDYEPALDEFSAAIGFFSRRTLLDRNNNSPMIVVNGADDVFVPQADTLVFEGRSRTEVHLIPGTGHCASSKLSEALDLICNWLPKQVRTGSSTPLL
jgi:esterase FrsA